MHLRVFGMLSDLADASSCARRTAFRSGHGDEEHVELSVTLRVAPPMHRCPQLGFVLQVLPGDELGVGLERLASALDDAGESAIPDEHDERKLRVVPRLVAEQLAECLGEPGGAGPELAF